MVIVLAFALIASSIACTMIAHARLVVVLLTQSAIQACTRINTHANINNMDHAHYTITSMIVEDLRNLMVVTRDVILLCGPMPPKTNLAVYFVLTLT